MSFFSEMSAKIGAQSRERECRPSACVVCGDPAIGYNYDAASCASCKAFFRRAVVGKQTTFSCCQRNGICAREPTLKPCRKCRYDKCIAGGMKPELVACNDISEPASVKGRTLSMDDTPSSSSSGDSKRQKGSPEKASVECQTNCAEETDDAPCDPTPSTSRQDDANDMQIVANPFRIESRMEAMMQNLISLESAHQKLRTSTYTPRLSPTLRIDDFAFVPSKLGNHFEEMYSPAMEPFSEMLFPAEVLIKMRIVIDLKDFDWNARKLWVIQDVIYTIEFIKALPIYQLMDDSSKKVLASSALVCTNLMIAYFSYSNNSDRTIYPDGSVVTWSADIQDQAPDSTRFHSGLIAALREVNLDAREYALLKNIVICNPILDGLQHHDSTLLQHEKERCTKTLLSYVLARSGVEEGPARFARILSIADVATKLTSWQKGTYITSFALGLAKPVSPFAESIFNSH
ncbi:hypothetical protein PRIPAC_78926 [Pristionchus pacificus]|uniref:Nuclear receptor n=1 Tax=Pristionchus pacificus TaxID=54126 RepID=A0A2A6CNZ0_PRIPA|nr:hypothetical protein PRIPAC_78926 [Pristionchus pacificus]|eukprot:PDM79935.1 nuclear receptor [Pristionchus pacificus]